MKQSTDISPRRSSLSTTKVGPKHQVTIPKEVFEKLELEVGDYLDVQVRGNTIAMVPAKLIPKDQAWFYTPEWQRKEREADETIARGEVSGPFRSAQELIAHLDKSAERKSRNKK